MAERTVGVLFVCSGNICRSPTAEGVFRAMVDAAGLGAAVRVDSAGLGAWRAGAPPDPHAAETALAHGIDISDQRARKVTAGDFRRFDWIVAMDRAHQRALRRLAPKDARARVRLFMDFAPGHATRDVPDPYAGPLGGFERVFALIEAGAGGLLAEVRAAAEFSA